MIKPQTWRTTFFRTWKIDVMSTEATIAYARANLEQQFDASMDRVTGWFKRNEQKWALELGLFWH